MSGNDEDKVGNVIEITTLSDEEIVLNWASQSKVSRDGIEKLFKECFDSMEAMLLLEDDDLARTKIPRGQQKLILAVVNKLLKATERAEESAHVQTSAGVGGDVTQEETPETTTTSRVTRSERVGNQSAHTGNQETSQHGGAQLSTINTDAFTVLLNNLPAGQSVARNNIVPNSQHNVFSGPCLSISGNDSSGVNMNSLNSLLLNQSAANVSQSQSWKDPQIFLESAASDKSAPTHYDITDFISNQVEEEIVVGGGAAGGGWRSPSSAQIWPS